MWLHINLMVKKSEAVAKAKGAAKAVKKGTASHSHKKRTQVRFRRPETQTTKRVPKFPRRSIKKETALDHFAVIKYPLNSEKAMSLVEKTNTLTFIVDPKATKAEIKKAVETLHKIHVQSVNTLMRPDGKKKAYVKLTPEQEALEVASKIGII